MGPDNFLAIIGAPHKRRLRPRDVQLLLDFSVTICAQKIAFVCFGAQSFERAIRAMADIKLKGLARGITVMKGEGTKTSIIPAANAFPALFD